MKTCTKCGTTKPLSEFTKDKFGKLGLASRCAECKRKAYKEWYKKDGAQWERVWQDRNREKLNAAARKWRADNPEKSRFVVQSYYNKNKDKASARFRQWRKKNLSACNERVMRREAKKKGSTPSWNNEFFMLEAYRLARLRTKTIGFKWQVDHVVPLASRIVCGLHAHTNISVIPARTNQRKGNRVWPNMP